MVPNQLLLKLTQVSIGICHNFSLFQEISFPEGVRHFLGLMEQPPTPLITLVITWSGIIHFPPLQYECVALHSVFEFGSF